MLTSEFAAELETTIGYLIIRGITYIILPFSWRKTYFRKKSFIAPFLVSSYFATHPITLLLEILGGRMHGPSPTSNFLGTSP